VLRDVREGRVSRNRARDIYRVALTGGRIDEEETTALRRSS